MTNENTGHVLLGLSVLLSISAKTIRPFWEREIRWRTARLRIDSEKYIQFNLQITYFLYWLFVGIFAVLGVLALFGVKLEQSKERDDHVSVRTKSSIISRATPPSKSSRPPASDTP